MTGSRIEIPIMHCFDNNYVIPAAVSFASMLSRADVKYNYKLYVLHSDITVQNQKKLADLVANYKNASLEFVDMNHKLNDVWNSCYTDRGHLSKEVLYKLLTPSLFPQYKKLVITDVDVVFLGDIAPSYFVLDEYPKAYYAGVRQINPQGTFLRTYYNLNYKQRMDSEEFSQLKICGGYLVANLELLREDNMEPVMIDYLSKNISRLLQLEQDVINFCCRDSQIVYLPLNYVTCSYMYDICEDRSVCTSDPHYTYREMNDAMQHPIQLHFATEKKPWLDPSSAKAEIWFSELKKTSFQTDYDAQKLARKKADKLLDCPCFDQRIDPKSKFKKKVSVICCTYNHERFIEETLGGILNQKTNFEYEIIVADDASIDRTSEIIAAFQAANPDKMAKTILRKQNIGIGENYYDALTHVEGEYLAICDGDDCWIDNRKLQMQVDFLDSHPDYTAVCTNFTSHFVDNCAQSDEQFDVLKYIGTRKDRYTVRDYIFTRFIASCTLMLRWQLNNRVPDFIRSYQVIDFPLALIHASMGYIGVLQQNTAKYNVHHLGISNTENIRTKTQSVILLYEVNQFLDFKLTRLVDEYTVGLSVEQKQPTGLVSRYSVVRAIKKVYNVFPSSIKAILRRIFAKYFLNHG